MQKETKAYVHVSTTNDKGEEKHQAKARKEVETMIAESKDESLKQFSTLIYSESQFDSVDEFVALKMPDGSEVTPEVKRDIVNRGWVLAQQAAAKALVLDDDEEYTNKGEEPQDISEVVLSPKEKARKRGTPQTRARKSLRDLMDEDPDGFEALIAEFRRENVGVVAK